VAAAAPPARSSQASEAGRPAAALEFDDAEARVAEGGWYRRDQNHTLYYRPGGHADPFLTAWIDDTANDATPAAQAIFNQLAAESAPGVCMKCHTVDRIDGRQVVNWATAHPQPDRRPFTTFKHTAHFSLMGDQGCATCHVLDATADHARGFGLNRDPAVFQSNFVPMNKDTCATCHQSTKAGDSCQQCHNYHTGDTKTLRLDALTAPVVGHAFTEAELFSRVAKNARP
jgi:nitrate/TMAO reductase-like tetraheme cytochrome c subunit